MDEMFANRNTFDFESDEFDFTETAEISDNEDDTFDFESNEFDIEGDEFDFEEDGFDFESDEFGWAAPIGGILGGAGAGAAYDWTQRRLSGRSRNSTAGRIGRWMKDTGWARDLATGTGAAAGTALGALIPEDADSFEPEYSSEDIEEMEALAEDAFEAESDEEAMDAADQMVLRSFGVARASARLRRSVLPVLVRKVRALIARARRDPRLRKIARLAPIALRRTAVTLLKMAIRGRPVTAQVALVVFSRTLNTLARSKRLRSAALRNHARRHRRYYRRSAQPYRSRQRTSRRMTRRGAGPGRSSQRDGYSFG
jgi:hypothetical protein